MGPNGIHAYYNDVLMTSQLMSRLTCLLLCT